MKTIIALLAIMCVVVHPHECYALVVGVIEALQGQ